MMGAGIPELLVLLGSMVAFVAYPILAFRAVRALTRIATSLERLEKR